MQYEITKSGIRFIVDLPAGDPVAVAVDIVDDPAVIPDSIAVETMKRIAEQQRAALEQSLCGGQNEYH